MIMYPKNFNDYEILDCGNGEKIERFGKYILRRPDPQAIWACENFNKYKLNAIYHRSKNGGGHWEFFDLPESWAINYNFNDGNNIIFNLKPFAFKHTGIFPEQATNWDYVYQYIKKCKKDFKVLNLFAYTGGATLACAKAGANVTHVDASKGMISWAKENAISSNIPSDKIRWIVDDCKKFVEREIRRGNTYDAIIMDPPSYGRGPSGEVWKIEDAISPFVLSAIKLLKKENSFFILNSYTTGLQASVMDYIVSNASKKENLNFTTKAYEIGILVSSTNLVLPEGASLLLET